MKLLIPLYPMLCIVGARLADNVAFRNPRRNRASAPSNTTETLTFETYDCEGMALDWSVSKANRGIFTRVVEYEYDLVVDEGSGVTIALNTIQDSLLRYVVKGVMSDCSRRLAVGNLNDATERQLDEMVIHEISSAPADTASTSLSCKIDDPTLASETECYPVTGYISVYYSSSGDFGSDVSSIDKAIKDSVKEAIENGTLISDTTIAVRYLEDRETISVDSSESSQSVASPNDETSTHWWIIFIGSCGGFVAMALAGVFLYKKKRSSRNDVVAPIEPVEVCNNKDVYFPNEVDEMENYLVNQTISDITDEDHDRCIAPSVCGTCVCLSNE